MFRNIFLLLCIAVNLICNYASADSDALKRSLKKIVPAVAKAGTIDYKTGCATCAQIGQGISTASLYSKDNDQSIELTVLSEDEANNVFSELAAREDIPFGYPMDGCYARAHKMVRILDDKGIIAGKAFLEGELYVDTPRFGEVGWGYHVAPVVLVKVGSSIVPYVFDPSLFNKAVPYEEWKAKITKNKKSKVSREYYTNRFSYDPDDRTAKYTDYTDESLSDMNNTNRNFNRMLFMYNQSQGMK